MSKTSALQTTSHADAPGSILPIPPAGLLSELFRVGFADV